MARYIQVSRSGIQLCYIQRRQAKNYYVQERLFELSTIQVACPPLPFREFPDDISGKPVRRHGP
jgi:hypothetical protein